MTVIIGAALVAALFIAGPAAAQGKDPFRPPAGTGGSGTTGVGAGAPAVSGPALVPQEPQAGGNLPRTGLDYSLPILASFALIIAGASMRLTSGALST